jgi:hypothetical protein
MLRIGVVVSLGDYIVYIVSGSINQSIGTMFGSSIVKQSFSGAVH